VWAISRSAAIAHEHHLEAFSEEVPVQSDRPSIHPDQLLAAVSALMLLVLLFAVKWYGPDATTPSAVNGWHGLIHLRWLILASIAASFMLTAFGAITPRSRWLLPFSVIFTLLALAALLWLGYRVLISVPPGEKPAAYVGLVCALGLCLAAGASLRGELNIRRGGRRVSTT